MPRKTRRPPGRSSRNASGIHRYGSHQIAAPYSLIAKSNELSGTVRSPRSRGSIRSRFRVPRKVGARWQAVVPSCRYRRPALLASPSRRRHRRFRSRARSLSCRSCRSEAAATSARGVPTNPRSVPARPKIGSQGPPTRPRWRPSAIDSRGHNREDPVSSSWNDRPSSDARGSSRSRAVSSARKTASQEPRAETAGTSSVLRWRRSARYDFRVGADLATGYAADRTTSGPFNAGYGVSTLHIPYTHFPAQGRLALIRIGIPRIRK